MSKRTAFLLWLRASIAIWKQIRVLQPVREEAPGGFIVGFGARAETCDSLPLSPLPSEIVALKRKQYERMEGVRTLYTFIN